MKVLIVDDEPAILEILRDMFESHFKSVDVHRAPNGALALHLCGDKVFNLIVTDYRMPVLDGLEFLEILRRKPGVNQATPVIFLSGFLPEFKYKAETYADVYFMDKPPQSERLMRICSIASKTVLLNPLP